MLVSLWCARALFPRCLQSLAVLSGQGMAKRVNWPALSKRRVLCFSSPPLLTLGCSKLSVAVASKPLLEEVRRIIKFLHLLAWVTGATSGVLLVEASAVIACVTALLQPRVLVVPLKKPRHRSVCASTEQPQGTFLPWAWQRVLGL